MSMLTAPHPAPTGPVQRPTCAPQPWTYWLVIQRFVTEAGGQTEVWIDPQALRQLTPARFPASTAWPGAAGFLA